MLHGYGFAAEIECGRTILRRRMTQGGTKRCRASFLRRAAHHKARFSCAPHAAVDFEFFIVRAGPQGVATGICGTFARSRPAYWLGKAAEVGG